MSRKDLVSNDAQPNSLEAREADEDDDYMSDAFLNPAAPTAEDPLRSCRSYKRAQEVLARHEESLRNKTPKLAVLEEQVGGSLRLWRCARVRVYIYYTSMCV